MCESRTGKLFVPPSVNADAVYNEAEYYQIPLPERPPTQPQQQQQQPPPAVIHDYFTLRVVNNSEWRNQEFVRDINVDIEIEPTDSELKEFLYSMPLKELGTQGTPKVVTHIEAHSAWRVRSWTHQDSNGVTEMSTKPGVVEFVDNAVQPGGVYTGRIVNNMPDGRGKFTYMDTGEVQNTYDGGWSDGLRNGRGVLTWPDGGTYDGEWKNDAQDGWGVQHWPNGSWYEGLLRGGYLRRGTWHDPNGVDVKEGEWVRDASAQSHNMQGWGAWRKRMTRGDDGRYIEATTNQPPRGGGDAVVPQAGATTEAMVTLYEGEWYKGKMHGHGMWKSEETGTIWCGEFQHGAQNGKGRMLIGENSPLNDPGGSYVGEVRDWEFHGEGVRLWSNGDRYQGNWVDGMEHGNGTKKWARDGSSFTGVWERGVPVKGTMEWPNGDTFTGTFTEEEVAEPKQGGETRRIRGEGVMSLSPSLSLGESNQWKGI
ncbi:2-isopropylmalate synthase [Pelomyxa schiedti]|nr:2-isopropylmalate synthase [Pelomyxa schiedti]